MQKAVLPNNGAKFCQKSIGSVRCSLAMSYDDCQRRTMSMKLTGTKRQADRRTGPHIESNKKDEESSWWGVSLQRGSSKPQCWKD